MAPASTSNRRRQYTAAGNRRGLTLLRYRVLFAWEDRRAMNLHHQIIDWYRQNARDLPWRGAHDSLPGPWAVLVSEFMLQQTPVRRVLPVFEEWLRRWPTPARLAAETPGEAVRAWSNLGYPRRALRLHASAVAIVHHHGGHVPTHIADLRALPGVGDYTAAAVASFAFGQSHVVMDINIRRLFARLIGGLAQPATSVTAAERARAAELMPAINAAEWSAATMELGALVCTSRNPDCGACPVSASCAWRLAGYPADNAPVRRAQSWEGTDRQCRGRIMAVLREHDNPVSKAQLDLIWPDDEAQYDRCLDSLVDDGLIDPIADGMFALPES